MLRLPPASDLLKWLTELEEEYQKLLRSNPMVRQCYLKGKDQYLPTDLILKLMVVSLAKQNKELVDNIMDDYLTRPRPIQGVVVPPEKQ